jgi:hypothetical protein
VKVFGFDVRDVVKEIPKITESADSLI